MPNEIANFVTTGQHTSGLDTEFSSCSLQVIKIITRMWANDQRDGRPAEYRWRPLFNAATFG